MRVLLSTYGSRGDTEPLAALGVALQALGAEPVVSAPPDQEFVDLLSRAGVPLAPAFTSVRKWIKEKAKPSSPEDFNNLAVEMIAGQYASLFAAAEGCDAILGTGLFPSAAAAQCVAEKMGVPYFHASFCPLFLPSHHHRPFKYPGDRLPETSDIRTLWEQNARSMKARFGEAMNAHRASVGLPAVDNIRDHVFTHRPLLASDPVLWPWQPTDLCNAVQTGAWVLPDQRPLPADLEAFLAGGALPVYVGFGSIALPTTKAAAETAIRAIRSLGYRAVMASGWADAGPIDDWDDCFLVGEVNQQALFGRVAAIVHHGGAGTTTTATRSGTPQVIVPQIVDQPYWATRVAALGVGIAHDGAVPTFDSLSAALGKALTFRTRVRANTVAAAMNADGARIAAELIVERVGREPAEAV